MVDKTLIEQTFDMMSERFGDEVQPDEVTARMLFEEDDSVTMRTHLNRLKTLVREGKMTVRVAKRGELAFKSNGRETSSRATSTEAS